MSNHPLGLIHSVVHASSPSPTPEASSSVEVTAESLYEAGVLAVAALRKAGWIEEVPGPATRLEIEVCEPVVKHTVTLAHLQRWVTAAAKSPGERLRRERLRELLAAMTRA